MVILLSKNTPACSLSEGCSSSLIANAISKDWMHIDVLRDKSLYFWLCSGTLFRGQSTSYYGFYGNSVQFSQCIVVSWQPKMIYCSWNCIYVSKAKRNIPKIHSHDYIGKTNLWIVFMLHEKPYVFQKNVQWVYFKKVCANVKKNPTTSMYLYNL